jgi:hypothetical protein
MKPPAGRRWLRNLLIAFGVVLVIGLIVSVVMNFLGKSGKARKAPVQQIAILRPPPPPPPPKQEEKPPELKKEEVKIPPPPQEQAPKDRDAKAPGKDLGVDAEGGAGGDGFGLVGKKGGRDLIGGDGGARTRVDTVLHLHRATILGLDPLTEVLGRPLPVVPQRTRMCRWVHPMWECTPDTSDCFCKVETRNSTSQLPAKSTVFLGFPIQNGN